MSPRHQRDKQQSYDVRDDYESDHVSKRERSHRRSSKYDDEYDEGHRYNNYEEDVDESNRRHRHSEKDKYRSSRHDREKSRERRKHRERSYDEPDEYAEKEPHRNGRNHGSSRHESRRESYRDRRDAPTDYSRDRDRSKSPPRSTNDSRHRHANSKTGLEARITEPTPQPIKREFKIQGRSKLSELDVQKEKIREKKPDIDPYALEREARQQERLKKEQQRRGSYAVKSNGERKRSHTDMNGLNDDRLAGDLDSRIGRKKAKPGQSNRRTSYRYDDEGNEDLAAKMAQTEREREAARWN